MDLTFWVAVLVVAWFNALASVLALAWVSRWLGVKFQPGTLSTVVVLLFAWPLVLAFLGVCWLYVAYLDWREKP